MNDHDTDSTGTQPRSLIAGCGDIGLRVAERLTRIGGEGGEVTAIVRTPQKQAALAAVGASALLADLDQPTSVGDWPWLFWFAPPRAQGESDLRLREWLAVQQGSIERVIYISTSGVYGDCDGRWIDESEPLKPLATRSIRRADAEAALHDWCAVRDCTTVILRVPGIYGPGRLPLARLRAAEPVMRVADAPFSNRVHADDLADAAILAARHGHAGAAYNIADGHPTTMTDYFLQCAKLLGMPAPEQISRSEAQQRFTPAMWSYMEESKRLRTERARHDLGFVPRYPTLQAGLPGCLPV
ncbi:MAG: NAD-dependent epimerase/dehydratase family protein [Pseudomonadota bacterium]|nr:NAD-dependent epimerase/dehydratase family protein [Pseudomonadota bacterium]